MTSPTSISLRRLLTLILVGVCANGTSIAATFQSSNWKSTPDPYFNPKNAPAQNSSASDENFQSHLPAKPNVQPLIGVWQADFGPNSTMSSDGWDPPRTPTSWPQKNQASQTPAENPNSIIREQKPFAFSIPTTKESSESDGNFVGFTAEPKSIPKSSTPLKPSQVVPGETGAGTESENQFGGDFSADLTNFKRPTKSLVTEKNSSLDSGLGNTQKPNAQAAAVAKSAPSPEAKKPVSDSANITSNPKRSDGAKTTNKVSQKGQAFEPSQLLAIVGNEPIFVGDLLFEVNQAIEKQMPTAPQSIKDQVAKKWVKQLLPRFVTQKILYIGAMRELPAGADVNKILEQANKEFDENELPKVLKSSELKSPNELDAQLRAQGSSLRKYRKVWSQDQLTRYFLSRQLDVENEVTHSAMLADYHKRFDEYAVPARARWEQVMVRFDRTSSRVEAEKQLVEMGNQIVYGANLAAVAKKGSHGYSAFDGGQHDWTTQGALVLKELDAAIFSLPIGELSDKIETAEGFHIVRVLERTKASHKPFLEAQVEIKTRMLEEKRSAAFDKHLKKLQDEIPVEYFEVLDGPPEINVADRGSNFVR